ncbi:MAG: 16S rRNA (guanine(966)-N(2))-methyltransferase RsmD [Ignavibacteria bacterium]|nr:16S rRNA (guanine(966)-N(2))-methyltransferase RsmD [Ignavibacteria bacterium]
MRIISGKFKSRKINSRFRDNNCIKSNLSDFRPTTDKARVMLFNVLNNIIDFRNISCLDLFAGSGSLGFEAISRGAEHCDFVESSKICASLIKKTASELGCEQNISVYNENAETFIKLNEKLEYDLIFADPPYSYDDYETLIRNVMKLKFSVFVLEHSSCENFPFENKSYEILDRKSGITKFKIFISKE